MSGNSNYALVQLGAMSELDQYQFKHPLLPREVRGKKFLQQDLGLTGMEVSLHHLPPKTSVSFLHAHRENEELYLFFSGAGDFQVDGEIMPIREGSAVRVAPEGARSWRNTSDVPMFYVVVQAKAGSMNTPDTKDGRAVAGKVRWPDDSD